jgi:hypothetical protein
LDILKNLSALSEWTNFSHLFSNELKFVVQMKCKILYTG